MILKSILVWLLIIPTAIFNGILREVVLEPTLGENIALPLSGILLSMFILLIACIFIPKFEIKNYFYVGLIWLGLTVIFEFVLGFLMGKSFSEMIQAYNLLSGNLWLLAVVTTGISPWFSSKIRKPTKNII